MLNIKLESWSLGIFFAISFVFCVIYGLIVPQSLHNMASFLELTLPAFKWLTFGGFCLGLIESFLYGAYIGLVFVPIHNLPVGGVQLLHCSALSSEPVILYPDLRFSQHLISKRRQQ